MQFFYTNNLSELKKLASDIEAFALTHQIPPKIIYALNLCLDEILTNIISYGFKEPLNDPTIHLDLSFTNNQIIATISDPGVSFNPLEANKTPDTQASIEDRNIGGLGVYFLEQYMDKVNYDRNNDRNVLTLIKNI